MRELLPHDAARNNSRERSSPKENRVTGLGRQPHSPVTPFGHFVTSLCSRLLFLVAVTTFIVLTTVGCERGPKLEGLVPCRGAVMFQDEPLAGAIVTFSPKDNKPGVRAAVATTDDKGVFSLMTLGQKGIFPGEYRVSIVKNTAVETPTNRERAEQMQQGRRPLRPQKIESVIPAKFNDEKKSGLEFLIGEQGARELKIEIESLDTKIFPGAGKVL